MEKKLATVNPGATHRAKAEKYASLCKQRETHDKGLAQLRKAATQKKKEHTMLMEKVDVMEQARAKMTEQIREARKEVGDNDTDSDGGYDMDPCYYKDKDPENGTGDESTKGSEPANKTGGKAFLRKE